MSDPNPRAKLSVAQVFFICLVACLLTYVAAGYRLGRTHNNSSVNVTADEALLPQTSAAAEKANDQESLPDYRVVTRVIEPNLLQLEDGTKVALLGVELPAEPDSASDRFTREALAFSKGLIEGRKVRLEYVSTDLTNNLSQDLAYVYLQDGTLLNAEVVKKGYGTCSSDHPHHLSQEFSNFEREALRRKRGVWSYSEPAESTAENAIDDLLDNQQPVIVKAPPLPSSTINVDPPQSLPRSSQSSSYVSSSELEPSSDQSLPSYAPSRPLYKPSVAENGSYYGELSEKTGRPKTVHVEGYTRRDGTYVRGHYRSTPKRH